MNKASDPHLRCGLFIIIFITIAFSIVCLALLITMIAGTTIFNSLFSSGSLFGGYGSYYLSSASAGIILGIVLVLAIVGYFLTCGILAIKWANNADKAGVLFVFGIINVVLTGLTILISLGITYLFLPVPIYYLVGASQNRKQARTIKMQQYQSMNGYNMNAQPNSYNPQNNFNNNNNNYNNNNYNNNGYNG